MDKAIITVLLIIAGIVASLAIFNGIYPAITQSSSAINSASSQISDQIESRIAVIQVSSSGDLVEAWVKNVGTVSILDVAASDIFMSPQDSYQRIPYGGTTLPYWDYQMEGSGTTWGQTNTIQINVHLSTPLAAGIYVFKMVIPNGISDEATFSVS
jgi:hypothetical protein